MYCNTVLTSSLKLYFAVAIIATAALHSPLLLTNTGSNFIFQKNILTWRHVQSSSSSFSKKSARHPAKNAFSTPTRLYSSSWLKDALTGLGLNFDTEKQAFKGRSSNLGIDTEEDNKEKGKTGVVVRTAAKHFHPKASTPSSREYTTRKDSRGSITLSSDGADGDYNHYRTVALKGTADRAVSILTTDILNSLRGAGYNAVEVGDLGENIYVDEVMYTFFDVGKRYRFVTHGDGGKEEGGVVIEITEKIEPCGNLCTLPFINDGQMQPKEKVERCKDFLFWLSQKDGMRGWYGRIIEGGAVNVGDRVMAYHSSVPV